MPDWITSIWGIVSLGFYLLTWVLVPFILLQRKQPLATLAWVWAILLFPFMGPLFYLLVGTSRIQRRSLIARRQIRKKFDKHIGKDIGIAGNRILGVIEKINQLPGTSGNTMEFLPDGDAFYPKLKEDIENAKHHVHLQFYIWEDCETGNELMVSLIEATKRGVEVRLIVDEIGSLKTPRRYFRNLEKAGGKFSWFSTFAPHKGAFHLNLRTHRKLVIVDGKIAYVGGTNVGTNYMQLESGGGGHRDLQCRMCGPVVLPLAEVFAEDWCFSNGEQLEKPVYFPRPEYTGHVTAQVVAGGPDNEVDEIALSLMHLINSSQKRLWLTTPYFVPDTTLLTALELAALRGVDIQLFVPAEGNHWYVSHVMHSYYENLLRVGIQIYEYQPSLLHTKLVIVDEEVGMVGSANLDIRSLKINFELCISFACPHCIEELVKQCESYREDSIGIDPRAFAKRPVRNKLLEAVLRPLAPVL